MLNLDFDTFISLIDNLHDEIMIWDDNYRVVYVNKACMRHYGLPPEEIIGQHFLNLTEINNYWAPSTLPFVYKEKKLLTQKQKTYLGYNIHTISVPFMDDKGTVKFVIQCARDEDLNLDVLSGTNEEKERLNKIEENKLIYRSGLMDKVVRFAQKIASIKSPCLILGETGTGKTLLAKYMHECSNRKNKPFININCAGLCSNLIESELFGYKKGAFSGANPDGKEGLIEAANGGTLFLDEIAEIPIQLQSKLLQVIQDEEFFPIGGIEAVKVDIKIISATNCDINKMIETGNFRADLYQRLNGFELYIPPLRERREDIFIMTYYFLNMFNEKYQKDHIISENALDIISNYDWPGNIRELSHIIEMICVTADDKVIETSHLPTKLFKFTDINHASFDSNNIKLSEIQQITEEKVIKEVYNRVKSTRKIAKELGISQSKACRLINKYIKK